MHRRHFLGLLASTAVLASLPAMASEAEHVPYFVRHNPANGHLVGYGDSDFIAVLMGFVPLHMVKECRLLEHKYEHYVRGRNMPAELAEFQPDLSRDQLRQEYEVMLDAMLDGGQLHDGAYLTREDSFDPGFLANMSEFHQIETAGWAAFDENRQVRLNG